MIRPTSNAMQWLSTPSTNAIDSKVFEKIKDCERASEVWKRLEETYEGTPVVKSAKLYILKDKLTSFKIKDDESIPEMFHRLQVIVMT